VIDAHAHCGIQDKDPDQSFESYYAYVKGSPISTVVMFPPVMEIYDRYDFHFKDTPEWCQKRKQANEYLLNIGNNDLKVIPYFFIWNDFAVEQLTLLHQGIKWHRHSNEPVYHYDAPECSKAIKIIRQRNLPVVFEEELNNTIRFVNEIAVDVRIIIPHLGGLNGGYKAISRLGIWQQPNIYTDTALAGTREIMDYIQNYGYDRILFGSDFPFGHPQGELEKIMRLPVSQEIKTAITCLNTKEMLGQVRR
jgi:hypothetical protein